MHRIFGVWQLVEQEKLHNQCLSNDPKKRIHALEQLQILFSSMPDKQQAWNDLIKLINDKDIYVRYSAAVALGSAFSPVPDKQQAWNDLIRLTTDEDSDLRSRAAEALGSAFSHVPDKQQAWNDLHRLTTDEDDDVRTSSNHSLGRVSIFMASQAETDEDYKKELEKAIEFFETAAKEASLRWTNPSKFCLPFYRSFHTIIFKKQEAKEEVNKYLEEARIAIEGSESKKQLFEAVENLAEALKEVQNLENLDFEAKKSELNFYRKYCDHAAELMKDTNEKAPFATKVLRKGLPILNRNLKELLEEIQEKAKIACQISKGTNTEEIACAVNREVQKWEIDNPREMAQKVENLASVLNAKIPNFPENELIFKKIEQMKAERNIGKQYEQLIFIITSIPVAYMAVNINGGNKSNISIGSINQLNEVIMSNTKSVDKNENMYAPKSQSRNHAVILTAISEEYSAVRSHLIDLKEVEYNGTIYETGPFIAKNDKLWNIAIVEIGMHTSRAAFETERASEYFKPDVILFVGVAGGIKDVAIGDVVAVTKAYGYEYGKEGKSFCTRPEAPESTYDLINRAKVVARNKKWTDRIHNDNNQIPKAFVGPVASGEKVIASTKSATYSFIRSSYNDALAVDMESVGFLQATHANKNLMSIVIRGISDNLDRKSESDREGSQALASINAAAFAFELISQLNFNQK